MSLIGEVAAVGSCLAAFHLAFKCVGKTLKEGIDHFMLKLSPLAHISRISRHICAKGNPAESPIEDFQRLASAVCRKLHLLDDATCGLAQDALRYTSGLRLFRTPDILKLASGLPCDHPGWRLLLLMVERTGVDITPGQGNIETVLDVEVPAAVADLGQIKTRLVRNDFTTMRPFAIVVWVKSRQKILTPQCNEVTFPANWKQNMLEDIESPALSILQNLTRSLLPGDVEYVFSQMRVG